MHWGCAGEWESRGETIGFPEALSVTDALRIEMMIWRQKPKCGQVFHKDIHISFALLFFATLKNFFKWELVSCLLLDHFTSPRGKDFWPMQSWKAVEGEISFLKVREGLEDLRWPGRHDVEHIWHHLNTKHNVLPPKWVQSQAALIEDNHVGKGRWCPLLYSVQLMSYSGQFKRDLNTFGEIPRPSHQLHGVSPHPYYPWPSGAIDKCQ